MVGKAEVARRFRANATIPSWRTTSPADWRTAPPADTGARSTCSDGHGCERQAAAARSSARAAYGENFEYGPIGCRPPERHPRFCARNAAAAAFLAQNRGCRSGGRQPMGPYSKFSPYAARALERAAAAWRSHPCPSLQVLRAPVSAGGAVRQSAGDVVRQDGIVAFARNLRATSAFPTIDAPPSYSSAGGSRWAPTSAEGCASST